MYFERERLKIGHENIALREGGLVVQRLVSLLEAVAVADADAADAADNAGET